MKRCITLLLVFTLVIGLTVGCTKNDTVPGQSGNSGNSSNKETHNSDQTDASTGEEDISDEGDPIELTFIERMGRQWDQNGGIYKKLEEKFDIKINVEHVQEQDGTQSWYSLRIASGDTPDYVSDVNFSDYTNYVNQGVFAEIPLEDINQHAPDMIEWYDDEVGEDIWNLFDINGKNYALPILWSLGNHWNSIAIRKDWLDDVGIKKLPETIEELEDALDKFKNEKNLDYVVSGAGIGYFSFVGGAYDVYFNYFYEGNDGDMHYGAFHPNTKEVLSKLNDWYNKGWIDKEFVTNKSEMVSDKWLTSKTGLIQWYWPDMVSEKAWYGGGMLLNGLKENDPNAELAQLVAPKGPDGSHGVQMSNPVVGAFCFSAELPRDKMLKYLEVFNDVSQNFETFEMVTFGIEGKHYEIDEQGAYTRIPPYDTTEAQEEEGIGLIIPGNFNNYNMQMPTFTAPEAMDERIQAETMNVGKYNLLSATYRPIWAEKGTQFNDFCTKNIIDFITGARNIDEHETFIDEAMNQYGGNEIMEEAQEVFNKIKGR